MSIATWIQVRYATTLAAHEASNRLIQYVYTFEGAPLLVGEHRVVLWTTLPFDPEPRLFLNQPAHDLALRLGIRLPEIQPLPVEHLPPARTLLLGLPEDVSAPQQAGALPLPPRVVPEGEPSS